MHYRDLLSLASTHLKNMHFPRVVLAFVVLSFFSTCNFTPGNLGTTTKDEVEVVILQLNDVYEIAPLEGGKVGGMARVAYLYNQLKDENPNTMAVLAGDFLSPSLLTSLRVDGEKINGRQMVEVLNEMGMDLVTFGNHEFDLDRDELQQRLNESKFMWASSNVMEKTPQGLAPFEILKDGKYEPVPKTVIVDFVNNRGEPFRLGVVTVTIPFNKADYVHYNDIYSAARSAYDSLESKTDIIIGLTHLDIDQDIELADKVPGLPLIMGGHDHENMLVQEGATKIAKADANAKTVWVHRITYNKAIDSAIINSELVTIDASIGNDPAVEQVVTKWMTIAQRVFDELNFEPDEVLMISKVPLDGREAVIRNQPTNLGDVIVNAVLEAAFDAEAAILNSGSVRIDDQVEGEVTQYDVLRMLPFGGSIVEVELTGALLRQVLQAGWENKGTGGYLQLANIRREIGTGWWYINDLRLIENQYYIIAMPEFLLTGGENNMDFLIPSNPDIKNVVRPKENDEGDARTDVRRAVIKYMRTL